LSAFGWQGSLSAPGPRFDAAIGGKDREKINTQPLVAALFLSCDQYMCPTEELWQLLEPKITKNDDVVVYLQIRY
jgi:hypothetical protein